MKRLIILFLLLISITLAAADQGEHWETVCENNVCTTTVYSHQKYVQDGDTWELVDESFQECGQDQYCTEEYEFKVIADEQGSVAAVIDHENITFTLANLLNLSLDFEPVLRDNLLVYEDVIPDYVDVTYQYLPHMLKEDIVIKQPLPNLPNDNFNVSFNKHGIADFEILPTTICDANYYCENIQYWETHNKIIIEVPVDFFDLPNITYPISIDPSILLNSTQVHWNGHITNTTNASGSFYSRTTNPAFGISLGGVSASMGTTKFNRGAIEWNISGVPDNATIFNVSVQLYMTNVQLGDTHLSLNISEMDGTHDTYSDTNLSCQGNCQFYTDMHDGTKYATGNYLMKTPTIIDLNAAAELALQQALDDDIFAMGLTTNELGSSVYSKDNVNASRRPVLYITYGVNTSDANDAIEESIYGALPGISIEDSQQVYLVNAADDHYTGTFDRATMLNNQTWAFNYVDVGESFINMPSLFTVLNIWEDTALTYSQIVTDVETFINSTMN